MDVVVWLRSLGLGKYEAAFRENEIDETVLPGLTAEDLKDLALASSGIAASSHARIAETLETGFADIAENQPEVLARHRTEAGQIEKSATLWGKAGQRSLERSALVEAVTQLTLRLTRWRPA